jgi:hypothetical protein
MYQLHTLFGILALVISVVSFFPYLRSILQKKTRPSAASWWTWTILTCIATVSSWISGAPWQVLLLPAWLTLSQLVVAILSTRYGDNNWDKKNKLFVFASAASIILWVITNEPLIALGYTIVADVLASIPNFRHTAMHPEQENKTAWGLGWAASVLALLAIPVWNFASAGWATYFFINMSLIMFFLFQKKQSTI